MIKKEGDFSIVKLSNGVNSSWGDPMTNKMEKLLIFLLLILTVGCSIDEVKIIRNANSMDALFFKKVQYKSEDINNGLKIINLERTFSHNQLNLYIVKNNTKEKIIFPDVGFGMEIYFWDNQFHKWVNGNLTIKFKTEEIIFLPSISQNITFPGDLENLLSLSSFQIEDIENFQYMRIMIFGVGEETGKIFSAFYEEKVSIDINR